MIFTTWLLRITKIIEDTGKIIIYIYFLKKNLKIFGDLLIDVFKKS